METDGNRYERVGRWGRLRDVWIGGRDIVASCMSVCLF